MVSETVILLDYFFSTKMKSFEISCHFSTKPLCHSGSNNLFYSSLFYVFTFIPGFVVDFFVFVLFCYFFRGDRRIWIIPLHTLRYFFSDILTQIPGSFNDFPCSRVVLMIFLVQWGQKIKNLNSCTINTGNQND